jgi:hypothetical protein
MLTVKFGFPQGGLAAGQGSRPTCAMADVHAAAIGFRAHRPLRVSGEVFAAGLHAGTVDRPTPAGRNHRVRGRQACRAPGPRVERAGAASP